MEIKSAAAELEVAFCPLDEGALDAVLAVEQRAYAHAWNRVHFLDAISAGYQMQVLMASATVVGYFVAMKGVDEIHLLNITVNPDHQGRGWAKVMLDALALWTRGQSAQTLWLEVRSGNVRAIKVYEAQGFRQVGLRKQYYPTGNGLREDALVMCMLLHP
jgi:ribosomal-protein-alanine N-acetyltransferase